MGWMKVSCGTWFLILLLCSFCTQGVAALTVVLTSFAWTAEAVGHFVKLTLDSRLVFSPVPSHSVKQKASIANIFPKQGNYHADPFAAALCVGGNVSHGYSCFVREQSGLGLSRSCRSCY